MSTRVLLRGEVPVETAREEEEEEDAEADFQKLLRGLHDSVLSSFPERHTHLVRSKVEKGLDLLRSYEETRTTFVKRDQELQSREEKIKQRESELVEMEEDLRTREAHVERNQRQLRRREGILGAHPCVCVCLCV